MDNDENGNLHLNSDDQLLLILQMLGHLSEDDLSFITDENAITYVKELQDSSQKPQLEELFPNCDPKLFKLLKGLLEFNPHMRLTAQDALKSTIFDLFREAEQEQKSYQPKKISQKINKPGNFSYDPRVAQSFSVTDYKKMLVREMKIIRKMKLLK